jgi:hypothetical protein
MLIRLRRTALSKTPHTLADGLMLVFQHPAKVERTFCRSTAAICTMSLAL